MRIFVQVSMALAVATSSSTCLSEPVSFQCNALFRLNQQHQQKSDTDTQSSSANQLPRVDHQNAELFLNEIYPKEVRLLGLGGTALSLLWTDRLSSGWNE